MPSNLDEQVARWHLEGAKLMGSIEFTAPDGHTTKINIDGTIETTLDVPFVEMCDGCETWRDIFAGAYTSSDGITLLWLCERCK